MQKAIIHFADGYKLKIQENQILVGIYKQPADENGVVTAGQNKIYEVYPSTHDGLTPSILEIIFTSDFFHDADNIKNVFNTKLITRIENL